MSTTAATSAPATGAARSETRAQPTTAKQLRQSRMRALWRGLALGVGLPTLLAALYYGLLASDQYESVTTFTVQSSDGRGSAPGLESLLVGIPGGAADRDVLLVRDYVQSRAMLDELNAHGLRAHYEDERIDWWSRQAAGISKEEQFAYYLDHLEVHHDTSSGALTLRLRAFDPKDAARFTQLILSASEKMVNQLAQRARTDRIAFAERELEAAQARLGKARQAILKLQQEGEDLNPAESAAALLALRGGLEADLARARAELRALSATLQPSAPKRLEAQRRVAALERELARQSGRLVRSDDAGLSASMARFEPLLLEKKFAEQAVTSALASLETARVDASRQHRYLVTVAPPSVPDEATHPHRLRSVLTVFCLSLVTLGILSLSLGAIREHGKF